MKHFGAALPRPNRSLLFHLATLTRRKEEPGLGDAFASVNEDLLALLSMLAVATEPGPAPKMFIRTGTLKLFGADRSHMGHRDRWWACEIIDAQVDQFPYSRSGFSAK
jgi:hypothetical protein